MNIYSAFATVAITEINYMSSSNFTIWIYNTFDLLTLPSILRMLEKLKKIILKHNTQAEYETACQSRYVSSYV